MFCSTSYNRLRKTTLLSNRSIVNKVKRACKRAAIWGKLINGTGDANSKERGSIVEYLVAEGWAVKPAIAYVHELNTWNLIPF